jgi:ribosome-associated toxin RatA of RatAB toxin-antitoxin module
MVDQATERTTIAAPVDRVLATVVDFEHYPEWARDIKDARVDTRDDEGRPVEVTFRAAAMGRSTNYTLRYDYAQLPDEISWRLLRGDIMRRLDGTYEFRPVDGDAGSTDVVYHLVVELAIPLPGFVKRRAEAIIMHTALRELKARVEPVAGT